MSGRRGMDPHRADEVPFWYIVMQAGVVVMAMMVTYALGLAWWVVLVLPLAIVVLVELIYGRGGRR